MSNDARTNCPGKQPSCHVLLSDKRVAKVHAIIEVRRVISRQAQGELFRNGNEIKLGDTRLVVEIQPEPR